MYCKHGLHARLGTLHNKSLQSHGLPKVILGDSGQQPRLLLLPARSCGPRCSGSSPDSTAIHIIQLTQVMPASPGAARSRDVGVNIINSIQIIKGAAVGWRSGHTRERLQVPQHDGHVVIHDAAHARAELLLNLSCISTRVQLHVLRVERARSKNTLSR